MSDSSDRKVPRIIPDSILTVLCVLEADKDRYLWKLSRNQDGFWKSDIRAVNAAVRLIGCIYISAENLKTRLRKTRGEHFGEEFTKVNPWQKVPVLDDNGFMLTESLAIVRYLSQKFGVPEHWYPRTDLRHQARVDEYLHWQHLNTRLNAAMVFQHKFIIPLAKQEAINQKQVDRFKREIPKIIEQIDTYFLKDKKFIGGDDISVADLFGVCELMQLYPVLEEGLFESNDNVKAWVARVKERLGKDFDDGHKFVYKMRESFKKLEPQLTAGAAKL